MSDLNSPIITWEVFNSEGITVPRHDFYAGNFRPSDTMKLKFQIWNNRWGDTVVQSAILCKLIIFSPLIEDLIPIINNSSIKIDGLKLDFPTAVNNKIYIPIKDLSGSIPTEDTAISNYTEVELEFNVTEGFANDLKTLTFDLEYKRNNI